jgi:hypothetical protein
MLIRIGPPYVRQGVPERDSLVSCLVKHPAVTHRIRVLPDEWDFPTPKAIPVVPEGRVACGASWLRRMVKKRSVCGLWAIPQPDPREASHPDLDTY